MGYDKSKRPSLAPAFVRGNSITLSSGAPADAAIKAGQIFIWFDPTNGSPAIQYYGKQADGTVVSGQLLLS